MHALCENALEYYPNIEVLVERLEGLKNLHDESASITNRIKALEQQQNSIDNLLSDNSDLLKVVKTYFSENLQIIQNNLDTLDQRLKKLK